MANLLPHLYLARQRRPKFCYNIFIMIIMERIKLTRTTRGQSYTSSCYLETSASGACGQQLSGNPVLPDGTGWDSFDGYSWNVINTGRGACV